MKIIFTHIPKTAGTSFITQMVEPNIGLDAMYYYKGKKSWLEMNKARYRFIGGHSSYGLHRLILRDYQYITFLRNPIDRAVSHYYFIYSGKSANYEHPMYRVCRKYSLQEVYQKNLLSPNLITKCIAGVNGNAIVRNSDLKKAKKNLMDSYAIYGIQERYQESMKLFANFFGWNKGLYEDVPKQKVTPYKPIIDEGISTALKEMHQYDIELYEFAKERFNSF